MESLEGRVKFCRLEDRPQVVQDLGGCLVIPSSFGQLGVEQLATVWARRIVAALRELPRGIETNCTSRAQRARAELY